MMKSNDTEALFPRPLSGRPVKNLPSALTPTRENLVGQDIVLERMDAEKHAEELFEAGHGDEDKLRIWDYLPYGPWENVASYASTLRAQSASFDPTFYAIRSNKTGRAVGQASFLSTDPQNGVTEVGHIWFAPELQRTRGATEALYLMIRHAFDDLNYRRMQWKCNALNAKSRAAALRLGFRFEGIHYNHMIAKGQNRDTAWYSILDDEWPEVREKTGDWLSAKNFDASGGALSSLSQSMQDRLPSRRDIDEPGERRA